MTATPASEPEFDPIPETAQQVTVLPAGWSATATVVNVVAVPVEAAVFSNSSAVQAQEGEDDTTEAAGGGYFPAPSAPPAVADGSIAALTQDLEKALVGTQVVPAVLS